MKLFILIQNEDVVLNRFDRGLLSLMDNVSLLADIKWPGVVDELDENVQIYSITVNFSNRCLKSKCSRHSPSDAKILELYS